MRETEVWDRVTDTVYGVWFTTERDERDGDLYVRVERVVAGNPETGEDVPVDLDHTTEERIAEQIAQTIHEGGML
jgi:hypothetical protein